MFPTKILASEIESPCQDDKVLDLLVQCNERFIIRDIMSLQEGLELFFKSYSRIIAANKNSSTGDQDLEDAYADKNGEEDDEMVDWGLDDGD